MKVDSVDLSVINPDAPDDSLEAKQPHVDNGSECYDKSGYFSHPYMQREWEKLWTKSWLIAGVESDLPNVGDYFLFDIGDESIIVNRTDDGFNAFYNVCSHRGTRLVQEPRGNKKFSSARSITGTSVIVVILSALLMRLLFNQT